MFDPYVYPGFPEPKIEIGQIWDTSPTSIPNLVDELDILEDEDDEEADDYDEWEDEEEVNYEDDREGEDVDYEDEFEDWDENEEND